MMKIKIAIIGGGAAGMMTAATLIESNFDGEIYLFERNKKLGAKVIISGGGRCNITTGYYRWKDLASKYIRGSDFVREAIGIFGPRKIFQRFESHGIPLKTEDDMRVFPQSDNGKDVVGVFERLFTRSSQIRLKLGSKIDDIDYDGDSFILSTSGQKITFDKVIIATGGNAYTHTGSTGDAYCWAKKLGHTITLLGPSLNSFLSTDKWMHDLSGLSFPNAKLSVILSDGNKKETIGPVLITHFGLSGPATFVISAYSSFEQIDKVHPLYISFCPFFELGKDEWNSFLLQQATQNPRKQISTILHNYLPDRMIDVLNRSVFNGRLNEMIGLCSKQLRLQIVDFLGGEWKITVVGRRAGDEFVTAGGVLLDEVNPKTMESKIVPGLHFVGEILNIDGVTGGYNLTSSWATGRLAGKNIF